MSPVTRVSTRSTRRAGAIGRAVRVTVAAASFAFASAALAYPLALTASLSSTAESAAKRPPPGARTAAPAQHAVSRMSAPVIAVNRTGPRQAGYVHYFVITGPDGEAETQVGVELPGDRIAWSFPEAGVSIAPFIVAGQVTVNGKSYEVEHLYGIRPFPNEDAMVRLRRDLDARVATWLDNKTPFCDEEHPSNRFCLSCLGFVLRVLYPGVSGTFPALPSDFKSVRADMYTTEDLLMYLAGVRVEAPRAARLRRIESIKAPESMREELVRIATEVVVDTPATAVAQHLAPRPAIAKPRATGRPLAKRGLSRSGS